MIKLTFTGHAEVSMVSAGFAVNGRNFHHGLPVHRALPQKLLPLGVATRVGALTFRAWRTKQN